VFWTIVVLWIIVVFWAAILVGGSEYVCRSLKGVSLVVEIALVKQQSCQSQHARVVHGHSMHTEQISNRAGR
jgi:hypothetical protein